MANRNRGEWGAAVTAGQQDPSGEHRVLSVCPVQVSCSDKGAHPGCGRGTGLADPPLPASAVLEREILVLG